MNAPLGTVRFTLESIASLEPVEALWRKLEQGSAASFFVSWTWIGTWLRCLPEHIRPLLLVATRGGEEIGAAILVPRTERRRVVLRVRQMHFNSTGDAALDAIWIEYNGFVGGEDAGPELWPAFLRWFARHSDTDELLVPRAADGSTVAPPADVRLLYEKQEAPGFWNSLQAGGVDAILARVSTNTRQQLRRSLRACAALGELRCEAADSTETALAWFGALKELHVESWEARGKTHAFRYEFVESFHRALIVHGAPDGSVQLLRISAGPVLLGYLYNFRCGRAVSAYQSGFDYSRNELRPGYVSHLLAMAAAAAEGATRYDFLAGANQLKRSLGAERYALVSHRIGKPTPALRVEAAGRSFRARFRR